LDRRHCPAHRHRPDRLLHPREKRLENQRHRSIAGRIEAPALGAESSRMTVSVFVGASVDGFIARPDGALDWLPPGGGEPHGYDEFIASVDAIVIGRKTFETVLTFGEWPYGEKRVVVLSS